MQHRSAKYADDMVSLRPALELLLRRDGPQGYDQALARLGRSSMRSTSELLFVDRRRTSKSKIAKELTVT